MILECIEAVVGCKTGLPFHVPTLIIPGHFEDIYFFAVSLVFSTPHLKTNLL